MLKILWIFLLGALVVQICAMPGDKAKGEADAAKGAIKKGEEGAKSVEKKAEGVAKGVEEKAEGMAKGAEQKAEKMAEDAENKAKDIAEDVVKSPKKHGQKPMDDEDCDAKPKHPHGASGMIGALMSAPFEFAKKAVDTGEGLVMGGMGMFGGFGGMFGM